MYLCSFKVLNGTAEIHPYDCGEGLNNCGFWFHMYSPLGVDLGCVQSCYACVKGGQRLNSIG